MSPTITVCTAGHRPHGIPGLDGGREHYNTWNTLAKLVEAWIAQHQPGTVITGMARGWDTIVAEAAIRYSIPLVCAIPFPGQIDKWPSLDKEIWARIIRYSHKCGKVHTISPVYLSTVHQTRNQWMVDRADAVLALWSGKPSGTANCVKYAQSQGKPVINFWTQFQSGTGV